MIEFKKEIKADIEDFKQEVKTNIAELRTDIIEFKKEIKTDIADFKESVNDKIETLVSKKEFYNELNKLSLNLSIRLGTIMATGIGILGIFLKF